MQYVSARTAHSTRGGRAGAGQNGHVRTPMTYAAGLALAATTLLAVAGCGQPEPATTDGGTVSVPIQPTITPLPTDPESVGSTAAGAGGLFDLGELLTTTSCDQSGGVWSYRGTLANETGQELDITVAISLVSNADATLLTVHELDLRVPAGDTVPVEAASFYSDQDVDPATVQCLTGVTDKDE